MASLYREKTMPGEPWRIRFTDGNGKRKSVWIGQMQRKAAETVLSKVEEILNCQLAGTSLSQETTVWLRKLPDELYGRLVDAGLVELRKQASLEFLIERYIEANKGGKSPATLEKWGYDRDRLVAFFGADREVTKITRRDCESYKTWLYTEKRFIDSTAGRAIRNAKMFFTAFVRDGLIDRNPFDGVTSSNAVDESRTVRVTVEETRLAMDYCPGAEWRVVFALARFGGMRPGEILALTWDNVKWDQNRVIVVSPKTKRHVGKGQRTFPLFPELRPYLEEAFEATPEGAVHVLEDFRRRSKAVKSGKKPNLGKLLGDILAKAGIEPWSKPFVSMRSSCETDLAEIYPIQVVTAWLGNSPRVAQKHYLQVRPEHFEKAIAVGLGGGQVTGKMEPKMEREKSASPSDSKSQSEESYWAKNWAATAGNAAQRRATDRKTPAQKETQLPEIAGGCVTLHDIALLVKKAKAPRVGLEPTTQRLTAACSTN